MSVYISQKMETVYDDGYFSIHIDDAENTLYYKIIGYPKFSEVIRNGHDQIFKIVTERQKSNPIQNIIADLLDAKILLTVDIKFIGRTSYRRLAKAGVKNLVILLTGEIHVQINVEKTLQFTGQRAFKNVALFRTKEEADQWFRSL